jgi:bifunctional UDP-N-acetylglucosamine pyrophosphorylase/glucosamine-1-phosphate N-acetyltransferase
MAQPSKARTASRATVKRPLAVVVLAAGKGTRFKSARSKVLHPLLGRPMLEWVLGAASELKASDTVVVVSPDADDVRSTAADAGWPVRFAVQKEQLGTAHALKAGLAALKGFDGDALVLCGDTPLLDGATLRALIAAKRRKGVSAGLATMRLHDPTGYGRVVRHPTGRIDRIIEHRDANAAQRAIDEVNAAVYCFDAATLRTALRKISRDNVQGEEYLPDVIAYFTARGEYVEGIRADCELLVGVNDRFQLAEAEAILAQRIARAHALAGVTIVDPATVRIEPSVVIAPDAVIGPDVSLHGATRVGARTRVQRAVVVDATIAEDCEVGPFAYLRPGAVLEARSKVGTYVEVKNSTIGRGSKVPHLSYVGDATIGEDVNVGAATVTVNYDGETKVKARTVIGDGARIGSDTMLIAPVTVGRNAATGAGSVVTRDVPDGTLVVGNPAKPLRKSKMDTGTASKGST